MGFHLRQSMLINRILFNSEAWHGLNSSHVEQLQLIDNQLLRKICKAHAKTSIAFLHLETATIPIRFIIASRRLNYLQNILKRDEKEVLLKVYRAQKENPLPGDFVKLVENDFEVINEKYDEVFLKSMSKKKYKKYIKAKVREAAFKYLMAEKEKRSKVRPIKYKKFKMQSYITSNLFSNFEVEFLNKIRSRNLDVKSNFKTKYTYHNVTDLKCPIKNCFEVDDQMHILNCKEVLECLNSNSVKNSVYEDIFSKDILKQKQITKTFIKLIEIRNSLLKEQDKNN